MRCELINQSEKPVLGIISWELNSPEKCKFVPIRRDDLEQTSIARWTNVQMCAQHAFIVAEERSTWSLAQSRYQWGSAVHTSETKARNNCTSLHCGRHGKTARLPTALSFTQKLRTAQHTYHSESANKTKQNTSSFSYWENRGQAPE